MRSWSRALYLVAGVILVALGGAGVVLPLLPTTPLLLLAACCFARSSPRMYQWLIHHRWLGPGLRNYRDAGGLSRRQKTVAIAVLWLTIGASAAFAVRALGLRALLLLLAAGCTAYLLYLPTVPASPAPATANEQHEPRSPETGR